MTALPSPDAFDVGQEQKTFGWLLYGNEQDVYEVHGACGFSRRLLYALRQITFFAARLHQCPESPVFRQASETLLSELMDMRQWSRNSGCGSWELAKAQAQDIVRIRANQKDRVIDSAVSVIKATAEAWRIAAMVYLQCRALR